MEKVVIKATRRNVTGKQVKALRREGKLPAVLYGRHIEATPIVMDLRETTRALHNLTSSTLVTIDLDGVEHATLVREKQRDYIRGTFLHLDFQAISLTEKIRTTVNVELHGVSPAVKDYNGIVVTGLSSVEVESLPQDLPERIVVDISTLAKIGDGIYVKDLKVSDKVTIHEDPEDMVVIVTTSSEEEEEAAEGAAAEPEVIEKGKKEEE